jgi:anti-sigma regulatory factor (Ser/Thr protein kinase)
VTEFARLGARAAGLPEACWEQLDLVIEEIFVNVVRHAYAGGAAGPAEVSYHVPRPGLLSVEISDQGPAYNPLTRREPKLPPTLDERQIGGLGVFLVRRLTESVEYQRDGDWNRLRFGISGSSAAAAGE